MTIPTVLLSVPLFTETSRGSSFMVLDIPISVLIAFRMIFQKYHKDVLYKTKLYVCIAIQTYKGYILYFLLIR